MLTFPVSWRDLNLRENFDQMGETWKQNPRILGYTACSSLPTHFDSSTLIKKEKEDTKEADMAIYRGRVDYNYLEVF